MGGGENRGLLLNNVFFRKAWGTNLSEVLLGSSPQEHHDTTPNRVFDDASSVLLKNWTFFFNLPVGYAAGL